MSSVRMCDNCGIIFSENSEGWGNVTGNKMETDTKTGQKRMVAISMDYCPECVLAQSMGSKASSETRALATATERSTRVDKPANDR